MLSDLKTVRKVIPHLENVSLSDCLMVGVKVNNDLVIDTIDFDLDSGKAENVIIDKVLSTLRKDKDYLLSISENETGANYKLTTAHHKIIKMGDEPSFYLAALRMFEAYCDDRFKDD